MVAELEKLQMIDEGFRNRIIDREKKQSTIFGGGIAFPHTINQGYAKTILMFGKLEEPYQKGDDWIEFIFLVAIPSEMKQWRVNCWNCMTTFFELQESLL